MDQRQHRLMVDASALIALFDPADQYHEQALNFRDAFILRYDIHLFTTNYVYSEAMSHLTHLPVEVLRRLDAFIRFPTDGSPLRMKQLWVKKSTIEKAIPIYFKYIKRDFSITDCTCFVLMEEYGIRAAFTFDDDYKIYTYQRGHAVKGGFWKLPEMLASYIATPTFWA